MITLPQGWCIDADRHNYVLFMPKVGKDGKEFKANESYHATLAQALERYYKTRVRKMVADRDMQLEEALAKVGDLTEEVRRLRESVEKLEFSSKEV